MIGWMLRTLAVGVLFLVVHGVQALFRAGLPWWGSLLAAVGTYLVGGVLVRALAHKLMIAPFKAKGAPLRGARLVVHSVTCIAAPMPKAQPAMAMAGGGSGDDDDCPECAQEEQDEPPADWRWFRLDATVAPPEMTDGPFRGWAPGELGLVAHDADTSPKAPTDDGMAIIRSVEYFENGSFREDEGMDFVGERRLRLTFACAPALRKAKLRYYFEGFGTIDLR